MPKRGEIRPLAERFWEKVNVVPDVNSCWLWQAGKDKDRYGQIWVNEQVRRARANRVAWFLAYGIWPTRDEHVLHICDNPSCVRVSHLFLGTELDNARDRTAKGRSVTNINPQIGEQNGRAKLNEAVVKRIRAEYLRKGTKQKLLGKVYGVSQAVISAVILRKRWAHVE